MISKAAMHKLFRVYFLNEGILVSREKSFLVLLYFEPTLLLGKGGSMNSGQTCLLENLIEDSISVSSQQDPNDL